MVWLHATGQLLSPAGRSLSMSTVHGGAGGDGEGLGGGGEGLGDGCKGLGGDGLGRGGGLGGVQLPGPQLEL